MIVTGTAIWVFIQMTGFRSHEVKEGGEWKTVSWNEAAETVATLLQDSAAV